jgi:hypothetical protein
MVLHDSSGAHDEALVTQGVNEGARILAPHPGVAAEVLDTTVARVEATALPHATADATLPAPNTRGELGDVDRLRLVRRLSAALLAVMATYPPRLRLVVLIDLGIHLEAAPPPAPVAPRAAARKRARQGDDGAGPVPVSASRAKGSNKLRRRKPRAPLVPRPVDPGGPTGLVTRVLREADRSLLAPEIVARVQAMNASVSNDQVRHVLFRQSAENIHTRVIARVRSKGGYRYTLAPGASSAPAQAQANAPETPEEPATHVTH